MYILEIENMKDGFQGLNQERVKREADGSMTQVKDEKGSAVIKMVGEHTIGGKLGMARQSKTAMTAEQFLNFEHDIRCFTEGLKGCPKLTRLIVTNAEDSSQTGVATPDQVLGLIQQKLIA